MKKASKQIERMHTNKNESEHTSKLQESRKVIELVIAERQQQLQSVSVRGPSSTVITDFTTHAGINS